ncbi:hypothetical protein LH67_08600 [Xenorhabdus nematophila]|nr:hypothetical protein LH67_08600 [Xenorhabdus nematophila]
MQAGENVSRYQIVAVEQGKSAEVQKPDLAAGYHAYLPMDDPVQSPVSLRNQTAACNVDYCPQ